MPHLTYLEARSPYRLVVPTLLLAVCALAVGQVSDGSLSGCVLDPSGSPIPGATISLTRVDGIIVRTTVTDRVGFYRLQAVPPAAYSIEASALGFATTRHPEVQVPVGTTLQLDFQLALSSLEESVQVSATVPGISPQSSEVGFLLDQKRISTLPLNRRDFLQLSLLAPGVVGPVEESELSSRGAFAMHANGAREEYNAFFLDGVDNNDPYVNRYVLQAPVETIQEFKILTNSYSAAYGRSAGAQIDVITRRGGNQYRFALYEYFRNRALDARNFFDSAVKPKYIRNQFGFSAGGPINKDRTHFFANVDLLREQRGLTRLGTVPTAEQRAGDLSGIGSTVLDPFTRQPFPGNRVPDSRISPVARSILNLFPTPNRTGLAGNYLAQPVLIENQAQVSFRVDHEFSPAQEIRVRYSRGEADLLEPYAEENQAIPGFGDVVDDRTNHFSAGYDQAFGSAFHALRFGYSELERSILPENYRVNVGQEWGVNWLGVRPRDQGYPALNIAGFSRAGDTTLLPIDRQSQTFHASDAWSTIVNRHALQFGGDLRHARMEGYLDLLTRGSLSFSGAVSGSGISDLLLGLPSFGLQSTADNPMALRTNIWSGYVQDDWKLRSDLTLNLGIRYDYVTPPQDPEDGMSALDLTTSRLVPVGTGSVSRSGIRADKNNFGPRLGLAWRPFSQVVLRGGFGVF
ncbi:MAG: TonB-dependent receptor, partial [Acidobacteria bacterium]